VAVGEHGDLVPLARVPDLDEGSARDDERPGVE
jgi:hypothetical protein